MQRLQIEGIQCATGQGKWHGGKRQRGEGVTHKATGWAEEQGQQEGQAGVLSADGLLLEKAARLTGGHLRHGVWGRAAGRASPGRPPTWPPLQLCCHSYCKRALETTLGLGSLARLRPPPARTQPVWFHPRARWSWSLLCPSTPGLPPKGQALLCTQGDPHQPGTPVPHPHTPSPAEAHRSQAQPALSHRRVTQYDAFLLFWPGSPLACLRASLGLGRARPGNG